MPGSIDLFSFKLPNLAQSAEKRQKIQKFLLFCYHGCIICKRYRFTITKRMEPKDNAGARQGWRPWTNPGPILSLISLAIIVLLPDTRPTTLPSALLYIFSLIAIGFQDRSRATIKCLAITFFIAFMLFFCWFSLINESAFYYLEMQLMIVQAFFLILSLVTSWKFAKRMAEKQARIQKKERKCLDQDLTSGKITFDDAEIVGRSQLIFYDENGQPLISEIMY